MYIIVYKSYRLDDIKRYRNIIYRNSGVFLSGAGDVKHFGNFTNQFFLGIIY